MNVIVTGASMGIGRGIARVLGAAGFAVGLVARNKEALSACAAEIASAGGRAHVAICDLRDPASVRAAFDTLLHTLGTVDALINNAGLVIRKDVFSISDEEWNALVETNLSGLFHATRAVLPAMRAQQSGHIINISSISGKVPLAGGSAYAATKYAVTGFSQSLFLEVRAFGIKVTTLYPGSVDSRSHRHDPNADHAWKVSPEEIGRACLDVLRTRQECCISEIELRPLRPPSA
jgi:NADP-dependent 3-hydroxy acid dehydrogenase YdfG